MTPSSVPPLPSVQGGGNGNDNVSPKDYYGKISSVMKTKQVKTAYKTLIETIIREGKKSN